MEYYVSKIAMVSSVYGQRQFGDRQAIFFAMTIGISSHFVIVCNLDKIRGHQKKKCQREREDLKTCSFLQKPSN